ncbi:hypothetical protein FGO68_gene13600 [Halteria grandinella]|uniref:Uncharacterized protein n=1 Tax=Halteria grandinella TaxID=5974 RepID=A0A8J8T7R6_HALGN|nr:hypothetical protein FGO68_gene13600 [Halteria grandinella]
MTFTELQSLKYNPNAQYFTQGNYILESYLYCTKVYKVLDNNRIIFCEHLSILTRLFTAIDSDRFVINYQIYSADINGTLRVLHNLEAFIFRDPFCICSFDNKVFYCHSVHSRIFVYDLMTNTKVLTNLRGGNCPRNIGIRCLTSVPGLKDYILFLEKGHLFKAQLDYHSQYQNSVEYVYSSKGAKILSSFKLLPDNVHVIAMDTANNFFVLDHFTCEIIHQVHIKANDFYIHPSFTILEYPVILIQESKSSQVKALSIGDDQYKEVKRWDVRVIGNLNANQMLAVDKQNQEQKLVKDCQGEVRTEQRSILDVLGGCQ